MAVCKNERLFSDETETSVKYICCILICLLLFSSVRGEGLFFENSEHVLNRLAAHGFENLSLRADEKGMPVVFYENRVFRDDLYAAAVVLAECSLFLADSGQIVLVPLCRGMATCNLVVRLSLYKQWMLDEIGEPPEDWIELRKASLRPPFFGDPVRESTWGRFDLTLIPGFSVYLGNYDDRFKLFLQASPRLSTSLWRGTAVFVQGSVPLYNDVNYQSYRFKNYAQITGAAFTQAVSLPADTWAAATVGAFQPNRWGYGGEVLKWLWGRSAAIGYRVEYTGFLLYYQKVWHYSRLNLTTSQAYAVAYIDPLNMKVVCSYNRYVMKDSGWLFEISRDFRETGIGAFAGSTQLDKFGGIFVRLVLSRNKQPRPSVFRVVLPKYYEYGYRATNVVYTQHEPIQTGIAVNTGGRISALFGNLNPNYLRNNQFLFKKAYRLREEEENEKGRERIKTLVDEIIKQQ